MNAVIDGPLLWIRRANQPVARLFCFHYAGGSASFCADWPPYLPGNVDIVSVQLPGREHRFREPFCSSMERLVGEVAGAVSLYVDLPYATFGHSMGATVSFEVVAELRRRGIVEPTVFFASGAPAPQFAIREDPIHALPDGEFCVQFLGKYFSVVLKDLLDDAETRALFLPQLKADIRLVEEYRFVDHHGPELTCPVVAFDCEDTGAAVDESQLAGWSERTTGSFRCYRFQGDHFFVNSAKHHVLTVVRNELSDRLAPQLRMLPESAQRLRPA